MNEKKATEFLEMQLERETEKMIIDSTAAENEIGEKVERMVIDLTFDFREGEENKAERMMTDLTEKNKEEEPEHIIIDLTKEGKEEGKEERMLIDPVEEDEPEEIMVDLIDEEEKRDEEEPEHIVVDLTEENGEGEAELMVIDLTEEKIEEEEETEHIIIDLPLPFSSENSKNEDQEMQQAPIVELQLLSQRKPSLLADIMMGLDGDEELNVVIEVLTLFVEEYPQIMQLDDVTEGAKLMEVNIECFDIRWANMQMICNVGWKTWISGFLHHRNNVSKSFQMSSKLVHV